MCIRISYGLIRVETDLDRFICGTDEEMEDFRINEWEVLSRVYGFRNTSKKIKGRSQEVSKSQQGDNIGDNIKGYIILTYKCTIEGLSSPVK